MSGAKKASNRSGKDVAETSSAASLSKAAGKLPRPSPSPSSSLSVATTPAAVLTQPTTTTAAASVVLRTPMYSPMGISSTRPLLLLPRPQQEDLL